MSRNSGQREQFGMVTGQSILSTVFQATDMDNGHCLQDVDLQQNLNTSPCGTIIGTISPTSLVRGFGSIFYIKHKECTTQEANLASEL